MTRVCIVGCGYVGCALAEQLVAAGHDVTGVRRSSLDTVRATGADAVRADVTDPDTLDRLPETDWLVFAASSGGRGADAARSVFVDGLQAVIDTYAERGDRETETAGGDRETQPDRLIYTSSTGVYGDHGGDWVDESTPIDPQTEKTRVLAEAERVAHDAPFDTTVVRFAGLYGPDRYRLERYLDGPVTEGYLNMLHRDDAAGVLAFLLTENAARGETVLAVDDEPVEKWTFADWLADQCGVEPPAKRTKAERIADGDLSTTARRRIETSKRCRNDALRDRGYSFTYPTYREGYQAAIEAYRRERS